MPRPRVSYSAARAAIDSGQATAEDIAANFDLVMDGPSVADQARASMERRTSGGDLPPGYENLDRRSYGSGVKDQLIPTWEGAKHLARTAAAPFAPTPENLQAFGETAMNAGMAQGHQAREAFDTSRSGFDALRRGDIWGARDKYVEAGGHVAAAVLPLVGPAAAEAGEDFKKGDIARFLGKSTALVGSMLVPAAAAKGVDAVTPAYRVTRAASLSENLERIAAASPNAPTITGIIKAQGPKIAKGLAVAAAGHAIPGGSMMIEALGGGGAGAAALKALYDLPKTAAFKAASVTMKTQFAKALTTGQIADAVTIGGRIVAGETAENMQPEAQRSEPIASTQHDHKRVSAAQEWPADENARDENYDLLTKNDPRSLLPERFKHARSARISTPIREGILDKPGSAGEVLAQTGLPPPESFRDGGWHANFYGTEYDPGPNGQLGDSSSFDTAYISRKAGEGDNAAVVPHELHHLMVKDMTPAENAAFSRLYLGEVNRLHSELDATGVRTDEDLQDPRKAAAYNAVLSRYPRALVQYLQTPDTAGAPSEVFAELGGQFMANPTAFKAAYPQWYGYYRQLHGKEYIHKHPR